MARILAPWPQLQCFFFTKRLRLENTEYSTVLWLTTWMKCRRASLQVFFCLTNEDESTLITRGVKEGALLEAMGERIDAAGARYK
eukprot:5346137-Lingulodinium_polyedra.AAC.1